MNATEQNLIPVNDEPATVNTSVTQQQPQPSVLSAVPQAIEDAAITPYSAYLEIQTQIARFENLAEDDQSVAITLPDYPFFTETKLQSISVHQSGTISIFGEAKGGKIVSIRDQVDSLSYALSVMSRPANPRFSGKIEVGFVTAV